MCFRYIIDSSTNLTKFRLGRWIKWELKSNDPDYEPELLIEDDLADDVDSNEVDNEEENEENSWFSRLIEFGGKKGKATYVIMLYIDEKGEFSFWYARHKGKKSYTINLTIDEAKAIMDLMEMNDQSSIKSKE